MGVDPDPANKDMIKSRRQVLSLINGVDLTSHSTNILDVSPQSILADRPQFCFLVAKKRLPIGVHQVAIQPETCDS